jgi:hypothetical protein
MIDANKFALDSFKAAAKVFREDLEALPEDAFNRSFGGKARTVADFVHESILVNDHIGMVLRHETPFEWPEELWIKAPEDRKTKHAVLEAFNASTAKIIATIEAFEPNSMDETVETEHGPRTRLQQCQHMILQLWYHSGQLNFIQTLLGDEQWHWS